MMMFSLADAFAQAEVAAPGIAKQDFLDQAREHLISGRLKAAGFPCTVTLDVATLEFEFFELPPHKRQEIPQIEWADLRLSFHCGGSATIGDPDQSPARQIATRDDCDFMVSMYSDVVLIADAFTGLWTAPIKRVVWTDDQMRAWVEGVIRKAGDKRIGRRELNAALQKVRENVPSKFNEKIYAILDELQGEATVAAR